MITGKLRDGVRYVYPTGVRVVRETKKPDPAGATYVGDWLIVDRADQVVGVIAADFTGHIAIGGVWVDAPIPECRETHVINGQELPCNLGQHTGDVHVNGCWLWVTGTGAETP